MHPHLLRLQLRDRGRALLHSGLRLRPHPHLHFVRLDPGGAVHRLHAGVGKIRQVIGCPDHASRLHGANVTFLAGGEALQFGGLLQRSLEVVRRVPGQRAFAPFDFEQLGRLARMPVGVGHHRDAARDRHHGLDARCCPRLGGVEPRDLRPEGRSLDRHRGEHARQIHVDAEERRPVDLQRCVQPPDRLANQLEVPGILQWHHLRHRHAGGLLGQLAIAQPLFPGSDDHAVLGAQGRGVDLPGVGGSRHQHGTSSRAGLAQGFPARAHRPRAAGDHQRRSRPVIVWIRRRLFPAHLVPVGVQLFGHDLRQRCEHTLAHLRAPNDHGHHVVPVDADEGVGLEPRSGPTFVARGEDRTGQAKAQQQRTAGASRALQKPATVDRLDCVHRCASPQARLFTA